MYSEVIKEHFNLIKDFSVITGTYPSNKEVYGLFYRMADFTDIGVVRILRQSTVGLTDLPFGTIEFNSLYGNIELSSYAKNLINLYGYEIRDNIYRPTSTAIRQLCYVLDRYYTVKWNKLNETLKNYDFLSPFNITLDESNNNTITRNINKNSDGSDSGNKSSNSNTVNDSSTNSLYAFGSQGNAVPTDKRDNKYNDTSTENFSNTFTNKSTDTHNESNIGKRLYTRKGNIGNISLSKLTIEERETARYNFIEEIFKDIADILGNGVWK